MTRVNIDFCGRGKIFLRAIGTILSLDPGVQQVHVCVCVVTNKKNVFEKVKDEK